MVFNEAYIKEVIPLVQFRGQKLPESVTWALDSRTVQAGDFFVALAGDRVDGHQFIEQAFAQGARGCLMSLSKQAQFESLICAYQATKTFILVDAPGQALCALAAAWRKQFTYPVVGITGSVGKTTTKAMLASILAKWGKPALVAEGNQNTLLSISRNILNMRSHHAVAVFEMGISRRGEMAQLAQLVRPTIGVITALAHSHMEGLGSLVDIAAEKRDVFSAFTPECIGVIDGDQPLLSTVSYSSPVIRFGKKMSNQIQARKIEAHANSISFQLKLYQDRYPITLATVHQARVYNALAAASVAHILGVPADALCAGLQQAAAVSGRFKQYEVGAHKSVVIDDSYNANPESMKAALLAFEKIEESGKKVLVIGDMLGLGINAPFWHRQIGRFLRKISSVQEIVFVGEHMVWAQKFAPLHVMTHHVARWEEAVPLLQERVMRDKMLVLVKASRDTGLRNLVHVLTGQK